MIRIPTISAVFIGLVVILVCFIPIFHISKSVGDNWRGIVPEYIEDSSYYYARINDVVRGYPLIGNPYFIEHKYSIPPAFFISDWIASIPFVIGSSFVSGVIFNVIIWSEIFVFILYFLFKKLETSEINSVIFSIITWLQVFWLFVRPVAMQVIFPGYALFLFSLFLWLENKSRKRSLFLVLTSLYCIYVYTYLLQIVFFTFLVIFINYIILKNWEGLRGLMKILLYIFLLSTPFLIFSYFQLSSPEYPETIKRIGLLSTHIPRMDFYYYGRWVGVSVFLWFISSKWITSFRSDSQKHTYKFLWITGLGLIIASGSNIFTGKELELSNHIGRFIIWWFSIAFFVYLNVFIRFYKSEIKNLNIYKKSLLFIIILICFVAIARNIQRAFVFFRMDKNHTILIQNYAEPIEAINKNLKDETVILADDEFSGYVPILTKHYVLFHPSGALQILSDKELEERYLVSRFFYGNLTRSMIENDVKLFGGAGKALNGALMQKEFDSMYLHYKKDIQPNIDKYLSKYGVKYIVINLKNSSELERVSKLKKIEVYRNENFVIYRFLP